MDEDQQDERPLQDTEQFEYETAQGGVIALTLHKGWREIRLAQLDSDIAELEAQRRELILSISLIDNRLSVLKAVA